MSNKILGPKISVIKAALLTRMEHASRYQVLISGQSRHMRTPRFPLSPHSCISLNEMDSVSVCFKPNHRQTFFLWVCSYNTIEDRHSCSHALKMGRMELQSAFFPSDVTPNALAAQSSVQTSWLCFAEDQPLLI